MQRSRAMLVLGIVAMLAALGAGSAWALQHVRVRLEIDDEVEVKVRGSVPFRARIEQPLDIKLDEAMNARVKLEQLEIPLDEVIAVPLKLDLQIPIDTEIAVKDEINLALTVPIDMVLTERELDMSSLEVPIDTEIFIDDAIDVDFTVPVDTEVTTLLGIKVPVKVNVPIKAKVPVRQKVRVRDTLKVPVRKLRMPFHANIPIQLKVPIAQSFHVKGLVRAPIHETISVPIRKTVHPKLDQELNAVVRLDGRVPARLEGELNAQVALDKALPAHIGTMQIGASELQIELE